MTSARNVSLTPQHEQVIKNAVERANVDSIPYWSQDLAFKLIKMNQLNWVYWKTTDTV